MRKYRKFQNIMAAGLLAASCSSGNANSELLSIGEQAVIEFDQAYDCGVEIDVVVENIDMPSVYSVGQAVVLATARPGKIILDPDLLKLDGEKPGIARHSALHELAHACTKDVVLPEPITLPSGITIVGFRGFQAFSYGNEDERLKFNAVEESVAELLASNISGIGSDVVEFQKAARLSESVIGLAGISLEQLQDLQEDSALLGFIALVDGVEVEELTPEDIQDVFELYVGAMGLD